MEDRSSRRRRTFHVHEQQRLYTLRNMNWIQQVVEQHLQLWRSSGR